MDENLVSILTWKSPIKSCIALVSVNLLLWFLTRQRPVCVVSICALLSYLKYLWTQRIRPEVLVNPPDSESWTNLWTYDFQHQVSNGLKRLFKGFFGLRSTSHTSFTIVSLLLCYLVWKIGSVFTLLTLIFLVSNGSFVIGPLLQRFFELSKSTDEQITELLPDEPEDSILWSPMAELGSSISSTVLGFGGFVSSGISPPTQQQAFADLDLPGAGGPESLTPFLPKMPDHEDSDEEFHFDSKHFDIDGSSTSSSTSFEVINGDPSI